MVKVKLKRLTVINQGLSVDLLRFTVVYVNYKSQRTCARCNLKNTNKFSDKKQIFGTIIEFSRQDTANVTARRRRRQQKLTLSHNGSSTTTTTTIADVDNNSRRWLASEVFHRRATNTEDRQTDDYPRQTKTDDYYPQATNISSIYDERILNKHRTNNDDYHCHGDTCAPIDHPAVPRHWPPTHIVGARHRSRPNC